MICKLSETCNGFPTSVVVYDLTNTVCDKTFKFNTFICSINVDGILENPESLPCNCKGSHNADKDHGQKPTGDLCVISDNKLNKIFCKSLKFRISKCTDFKNP